MSVLLLEAGGPDSALELHVPAAFSKLFRGAFDWNYDTVRQPSGSADARSSGPAARRSAALPRSTP